MAGATSATAGVAKHTWAANETNSSTSAPERMMPAVFGRSGSFDDRIGLDVGGRRPMGRCPRPGRKIPLAELRWHRYRSSKVSQSAAISPQLMEQESVERASARARDSAG